MKRLFYGVAVSALVLGAGGAAVACDQHAKSAALQNPAAATHAFNTHGFVLAQAQQEEQSGTSGQGSEESKPADEGRSEALPSRAHGQLAQAQDDSDKEKAEDESKEQKSEAVPIRRGGFVLAQMQQDDQSSTTGEDTKESKPEGEDQK